MVLQPRDFTTILRQTHPQIRAYIAGMGIAPHEVDDVAQEVYLQLYRGFSRLPADVEPIRWLKGIARNLCLNHIRRSARRGRLHREMLAERLAQSESAGAPLTSQASLSEALDGCYQKLPADSRKMLQLRYEQQLSSDSIAAALQSTSQAVRVALHRIRRSLRDCITQALAREGA